MGGKAKRFGMALLVALLGYAAGGFGGGALVSFLSSNTHDRSVEAAMTGAFVTGPLVAVVGFVVAYLASAPNRKAG